MITKIFFNSNGNIGTSITTASSTISTQGKITIVNSDKTILEATVSDSVVDIIPIKSDILNSSSAISSRTKQICVRSTVLNFRMMKIHPSKKNTFF